MSVILFFFFPNTFYLSLIPQVISTFGWKVVIHPYAAFVEGCWVEGRIEWICNFVVSGFRKLGDYPLTPRLMSTLEGIPCEPREHSLQGVIPRSLSIVRSKGFYPPGVWESHGGWSLGRNVYFQAVSKKSPKNCYEACKGFCGSIRAEWLKAQCLKIFCWNCSLGSASYWLSILRKMT